MKPIDVRIENYDTQTGVGRDGRVMWKYGPGRHFQSAWQIDVRDEAGRVFSSGKTASDQQNHLPLPSELLAAGLKAQSRYGLTVTAWDEADEPEVSEEVFFFTGVEKWSGKWIGNGTAKPFLARRSFQAKAGETAVLSLCVPGQYEVLLNGKKISPYCYEGCQTDFDRHVHYMTYDLSAHLAEGENVLTVEAANGWYIGDDGGGTRYFYTINSGYHPYGSCLCMLARLRLGDRYLVTDESWEVSPSRTTLADIYGSEDMDYTLPYSWSQAQIVPPPKGTLIPFSYPPVIHKECYEPESIDKERMIFDFGQNMASQFYLKIRGRRGQKVTLLPAEKLGEDGDILQTVSTSSVLTLSGGEDVFEQKFSVNGARWYKILGADYEQILDFRSYFSTSSARDCGTFTCSDERLNGIYRIIMKAVESNTNHLHTDCPTIEKLGWLEPNHLMARSIMFNKEVNNLWSKISMDMRDAQYAEDESDVDTGAFPHEYQAGLIPSIAPRYAHFIVDYGVGSFWDIIPWGSSLILGGLEQYRFYGETQVLRDNYEAAKRYLAYLTDQYEDYNRLYHKEGDSRFICAGLGDWGIRQNDGTGWENIETAYYYWDLVMMAKISAFLGKGDEEDYLFRATEVKRLYNRDLLVTEGGKTYYKDYRNGTLTQANQAIPLCFDMVPAEQRAAVEKSLIDACEGHHLHCGEIGLPFILRALAAAGRDDVIYDMVTKEDHPSYLRFVRNHETTLPEFWRDDARSRNHDMMGHIVEWLFWHIAGIQSEDGFAGVRICPKGTSLLESFSCSYDSVRGRITVEYKNGQLEVSLPMNVKLLA